jgi:serine/threonine protein kinase/tetratricopeptide (TPR) repeat protein
MIGLMLGSYRILEKLGEGGMGEVYKAQDSRLDRSVAIKVLPAQVSADPGRRARFEQEARAASALNHPHIVTIYDILDTSFGQAIVMEFVQGRTLAQLIKAGPLPVSEAVRHAVQIADALSAAHAKAIVHRDLKPANLMLSESGLVKVLDFGVAKLTEAESEGELARTAASQTTVGLVVGTLAYMSPEQAEGKPLDGRSDIFSFGSVLHEMLSGRRPFAGNSGISLLTSILRDEPAPLAGVPPDLARIVSRCLRKRPRDRYQSAAELKVALEQVVLAGKDSQVPSIAVLPFANLSAEKENEYFSDGLAEEIINALTQLKGLRVIARTSSFSFRGKEGDVRRIGAELNVENILEGSVRKAGNRIRVTAQLIDVAGGHHLWSERYDREMTDVFAIQDDIAAAIVQKLQVRLSGDQPLVKRYTENIEAYNLHLEGRHYFMQMTPESLVRSRDCYERALAIDHRFALAYCGLADYHHVWGYWGLGPPRESLSAGKAAVLEALKLDDTLAEAHSLLAIAQGYLDCDWGNAERVHRRAIELNPGSPQVHFYFGFACLRSLGRLDEAIAEVQQAVELDPLSANYRSVLGYLFHCRGQVDVAFGHYRHAIEIDPSHYFPPWLMAISYLLQGMPHEAVAAAEKGYELSGRLPAVLGALGAAYAAAGKPERAREVRGQVDDALQRGVHFPGLALAWMFALLGEVDAAFEWMSQAVEARDPSLMIALRTDPSFDKLRPDPRFRALLRKVNLG